MNIKWLRMPEVYAGQVVTVDDGFDCMESGKKTIRENCTGELYIECDHGRHYLSGQENEHGFLVGITL